MKFIVGLLFSISIFGQTTPTVEIYTFHLDVRACAIRGQIIPVANMSCDEHVLVIATTTDPSVVAFKITIDFVDENGQDQHREGLAQCEYGGGATYWFTGPIMKGIIIRKVTAQPYKPSGGIVEFRP